MSLRSAVWVCVRRPALLSWFAADLFIMPRSKWYSPRLRRDLVTRLYFRAQEEGIPMTRLADRLIEQAPPRAQSDIGGLSRLRMDFKPLGSLPTGVDKN